MCIKHMGIESIPCAICKGEKLLPELENIGYDTVQAFKTAGWLLTGKAMANDRRRARNEGNY